MLRWGETCRVSSRIWEQISNGSRENPQGQNRAMFQWYLPPEPGWVLWRSHNIKLSQMLPKITANTQNKMKQHFPIQRSFMNLGQFDGSWWYFTLSSQYSKTEAQAHTVGFNYQTEHRSQGHLCRKCCTHENPACSEQRSYCISGGKFILKTTWGITAILETDLHCQ